MLKRRLFNQRGSDISFNSSAKEEMNPNRGGIHPALCGTTPGPGSEENNISVNDPDDQETPHITEVNSVAGGSDSMSDSMGAHGFFSVGNYKLPYTKDEDEMILKYVLKGENIFKVSSILLWKHLEAKKENPKRTYQSLKNRFLRNIKPVIFTTFGHLVKDQTVTNNILAKFPELRQRMGQRETLPRIQIPERRRKVTEENKASTTSTNVSEENIGRATPLRLLDPNDRRNAVVQIESEPVPFCPSNLLSPDVFKPVIYKRIVRVEGDDVTVCVNFKIQINVETPFSSTTPGVYERFKRLEKNNKLVPCPCCGVPSRRKRVTPLTLAHGMEFLIPNSIESPEKSVKNIVGSKLNNSGTDKQKKVDSESESLSQSPDSPSLLIDIGEASEIDRRVAGLVTESSKEARVEQVANSVGLSTCASEDEGTNKVDKATSKTTQPGKKADNGVARNLFLKTTASSSRSNKEVSQPSKRLRESDAHSDSICEEAVADFRKLMDSEEEQLLVEKCLNRDLKRIGLEPVSQTNWDSYLLESSMDMDTPSLTIDYASEPDTREVKTQSKDTSDSSDAENTRMVLRRRLKKS